MALQPFDYTLKGVQDPATSFMSGMKQSVDIMGLQAARQEAKLKQEQAIRAQAQQEAMAVEMAALAQNPTVQGINRMMAKYPSIADKYKPLLESMTDQQKQARIKQANDIVAPMLSGRKDIAINNLNTQVEAAKNAGDDQTLRSLNMVKDLIESQETGKAGDNAALLGLMSYLSVAMGEKEFAKTYEGLSKVQIEQAEAPAKLSKAQADAMISQNKAKYGENKQTLNTSSGIYERQDDGSWKNTGLMPFAAPAVQVSLNQGQKGFENETTLRKEFNNEAKPFNEVASAFSRLQSAAKDDSGASDIAMIYSYMKMLDPGSVVREGEFATAENAGGVGEKVRNLYNKVMQGSRLTPAVRADYLKVAERLNTGSKVKFNKLKTHYRGIAEGYGLKPANVITLEEPETPASPTAPTVGSIEDGYRFKGGNPSDPANWEKI